MVNRFWQNNYQWILSPKFTQQQVNWEKGPKWIELVKTVLSFDDLSNVNIEDSRLCSNLDSDAANWPNYRYGLKFSLQPPPGKYRHHVSPDATKRPRWRISFVFAGITSQWLIRKTRLNRNWDRSEIGISDLAFRDVSISLVREKISVLTFFWSSNSSAGDNFLLLSKNTDFYLLFYQYCSHQYWMGSNGY